MDHDHDSSDRDPVEPADATGPTPLPKRPGFPQLVLSLLSRIPLPSLGSERHEVLPEPAISPSAEPLTSVSPVDPAPNPTRGRFSPLSLKRETRVGIAAFLSFALLVVALVVKKGWVGKPVTLALAQPASHDPATPVPGAKPDKPAPNKEHTGSPPDSKPLEVPKPPETTPVPATEPPGSLLTMGDSAVSTEPATLPPTGGDPARPPTLPGALPARPSSAVVGESLPKPPVLPTGPGDPIQLPGESGTPPLPNPAEPPPPVVEPKPSPQELNPAPTNAPPPMADPPVVNSPENPAPAPPVPPEPISPPITAPPITAPPVASSPPVPTEKTPPLESVPVHPLPTAGSVESSATQASTAGALGAGWIMIPSGGRRIAGSYPIVSTPAEVQADPPRIADGPRAVVDSDAADQVEPVVHVVRPGENFWTISKLYYRSGRFYKALHAANRRQVPDIRQLYVGTVLRVPPPEALDRSLIDPAGHPGTDDPAASIVSRTSKRSDPRLNSEDVDLAMPFRPRTVQPDPEAVEVPRRPTYKVKPHETLRSIARDTLDDPTRYREIYNLNRDVLDDINVLAPGTTLTLPQDAIVGRRSK